MSRIGHNKEQEVDSLTDMLVQGMGNAPSEIDQEDIYGVCVKCGEKVCYVTYIYGIIFHVAKIMLNY